MLTLTAANIVPKVITQRNCIFDLNITQTTSFTNWNTVKTFQAVPVRINCWTQTCRPLSQDYYICNNIQFHVAGRMGIYFNIWDDTRVVKFFISTAHLRVSRICSGTTRHYPSVIFLLWRHPSPPPANTLHPRPCLSLCPSHFLIWRRCTKAQYSSDTSLIFCFTFNQGIVTAPLSVVNVILTW